METIEFHSVLPQVFAGRGDIVSDVWRKDVSFDKGRLYLVEAESGKGKSTFCSYIMGYRHDYSGDVLMDGKNVRDIGRKEWTGIRRNNISYLFQELRLFPELTAFENVEIKNRLTGFKTRSDIERWFDMLGIADKMNTRVGQMSFGQQQRVAMMRALVQPFDFILADEPVSHLDEGNSAIMGDIMMTEARAQGAGVIVTSIGKHMALDYEKVYRL